MARLKNNGIEILRLLRIRDPQAKAGSSGAYLESFRDTISIRSNGAIMQKSDHRWSDDPEGKWRSGSWKIRSKLPAKLWRKADRRSWIESKRIAFEVQSFELLTAESEIEQAIRSMEYMIEAGRG